MIFDALTYTIIAVGVILTFTVFHLARTRTDLKQKQENKQC